MEQGLRKLHKRCPDVSILLTFHCFFNPQLTTRNSKLVTRKFIL